MPLTWAVGQLPGIGLQIGARVIAIVAGIPMATMAGKLFGGKKDNQAIIWDEIATTPIVFLLVLLSNWKVAPAGFAAHRMFDITKPPSARQLERLPEGLGVMEDDCIAGIYGCLLMGALAWAVRRRRGRHFRTRLAADRRCGMGIESAAPNCCFRRVFNRKRRPALFWHRVVAVDLD